MTESKYGDLETRIYPTRQKMGAAAAQDVAEAIERVLQKKETCNMIFAAAPSQNELLASLAENTTICWQRVVAFHMDEYCGLCPDAPQAFGTFLDQRLFARVPLRKVFHLRDVGTIPEEICQKYSTLLREYPVDLVCLGIGENGHIAFNDPAVANFSDLALVKEVELDEVCRQQQVNDGCFPSLEEVPTHAVTLTIPALCAAEKMFCVVPGYRKAEAVRNTCLGPVSELCPASILRRQKGATLYLDAESATELEKQ